MERVPKRIYTKEFREEAVKLVIEGGLSVPEAGRRLSLRMGGRSAEMPSLPNGKKIVSFITESETIRRILEHLKLWKDPVRKGQSPPILGLFDIPRSQQMEGEALLRGLGRK